MKNETKMTETKNESLRFTIKPSRGDNFGMIKDRTDFTVAKGDRVVVGDHWNYHLATVVGFGVSSVKVKFTNSETVSFDELGWQWGTRGNHGWNLYSLDEGFARVNDNRVTYRDRAIKQNS